MSIVSIAPCSCAIFCSSVMAATSCVARSRGAREVSCQASVVSVTRAASLAGMVWEQASPRLHRKVGVGDLAADTVPGLQLTDDLAEAGVSQRVGEEQQAAEQGEDGRPETDQPPDGEQCSVGLPGGFGREA